MSRRGSLILGGGILAGLLFLALIINGVASQSTPKAPRPPELGGQQVPDKVYEIQFDQHYDLFCSFYPEEPTIYRNCKILGFTGGRTTPSRASGSGGISGFSGSGSASYYTEYFDHWLVLEMADGRLAYIPPHAIKYIEEATSEGE